MEWAHLKNTFNSIWTEIIARPRENGDQKNGTWHTNVLRVHSMHEHKKIKPEHRRIAGTQTFLCAWKFLMAWAAEGLSPAAPALSADRCSPAACFAGSCKITILFSGFDDATQKKHLVLVMVGRALALSLLTQLRDVFDDLLLRGSPHQFARLHNNTMPQNRITEKR